MDGIVAIFVLMCLLGMIATIPIAFGWMRKWGLAGAKDAFMVGGASFCALIMVAALSGPPANRGMETTGARSAPSQVVAAPQAKQRPTLDKIRIGNVLWERMGLAL
jgi:hypothetical protein